MAPAIGLIAGIAAIVGTGGSLIAALKKPKKQPQLRKDPIDDSLPASGGQAVAQLPQVTIPKAQQQPLLGANAGPVVIPQGQQGQPNLNAALQQLQNQVRV